MLLSDSNEEDTYNPIDLILIELFLIVSLITTITIYKYCCKDRNSSDDSPVLSLEKSLNSDFIQFHPSLTEELLNKRKEGQFYGNEVSEESENETESEDFRIKIGENLTSSNTNSQSVDEISSTKSNVENVHFESQESEENEFHSLKGRKLTPIKDKNQKRKILKHFKKTKTQAS